MCWVAVNYTLDDSWKSCLQIIGQWFNSKPDKNHIASRRKGAARMFICAGLFLQRVNPLFKALTNGPGRLEIFLQFKQYGPHHGAFLLACGNTCHPFETPEMTRTSPRSFPLDQNVTVMPWCRQLVAWARKQGWGLWNRLQILLNSPLFSPESLSYSGNTGGLTKEGKSLQLRGTPCVLAPYLSLSHSKAGQSP